MFLRSLQPQWFLIGLAVALAGGLLLPGLGEILNPGGNLVQALTVLIFLVTGFTLPSEAITKGLRTLRMHLFIQGFIFVLVPLYFALTAPLFSAYLGGRLEIGLYALAVLPTTISTCVVFTQTSGGNTVGAIFNSALSNVLGIAVSPLLLSLFLRGTQAALPAHEVVAVFRNLVFVMLIPVVFGQLLRRRFERAARGGAPAASLVNSGAILIIVFITFSMTAADAEFMAALTRVFVPFAFLAVSHVALRGVAYLGAKLLSLGREDIICTVYSAPQKTMAMGVPLLTVYFAGAPDLLGYALLPLLFYHPWQLLVAGVIRGLIGRQRKHQNTGEAGAADKSAEEVMA